MQKREPLHNSVYKDILLKIYEGTLPNNCSLKTLSELRESYGVSDNCIRTALSQLKSGGYIATGRGRAAKVVFDVNAADKLPQIFTCDKKNLYTFYDAIEILFPSLYTFAAFTCTSEQLAILAQIVEALPQSSDSCEQYIELNIKFCQTVLFALKNELIVHMVTTVMRNTLLPTMLIQRQSVELGEDYLQGANVMRSIYKAMLQRDRAKTKQEWKHLIIITKRTARKVVERCVDIPEKGGDKWAGLQYANDFKYLLITHDVYQRLLDGEYAVGDYLPTIEQSQRLYQAGAVTVRRAYRILGEFGLTQTTNGCGTMVMSLTPKDGTPLDFGVNSASRTTYLEALEFFMIVCGDLLRSGVVPTAPIKSALEGTLNPDHRYSTIILCKEMMRAGDTASTQAIFALYRSISRHLFWGIHRPRGSGNLSIENKHSRCIEIAKLLDSGQTERAIAKIRELITELTQNTQQIVQHTKLIQ